MFTDFRKVLDAVAVKAGWKAGEIRSKMFRHTFCAAALQLLVAPEVERVTGALFSYIRRFKAVDIPLSIRDEEMRRRLWELSERLSGLTSSRRP